MRSPQTVPNAFALKDFCTAYSIGRTLAYEEIGAGRLKAKKVGKRTLILKVDADEWAASLPDVGPRNGGPRR